MAKMTIGKKGLKLNKGVSQAPEPNVVWQPMSGTSQEFALDTRADHTLFHGTRGRGSTAVQLMLFRRFVGLGYGKYWRGIIFEREFKHLEELVTQSKRFFSQFEDGCKFLESGSDYKWVWPTGEELLFRHAKKESDYDAFHGHEYPFIGWSELTKWASGALYHKMMACNRSSFTPDKDTPKDEKGEYITYNKKPLPPIPLKVFSTANPSGPGRGWVKLLFIDAASNGVMIRKEVTVYDPRSKKEVVVVKTQVAIFGSWRENIYLPPLYIAGLKELTDENLRAAWYEGNWDAIAGGAFDDVFFKKRHVKTRFRVPATWKIDRSFDWGSSHPFSVGWWAEANGEEADIVYPDGTVEKFCPPPGSLIQIDEIYGTKEIGSNVGLKLSAPEIAKRIKKREMELMAQGWIIKQPSGGPADNQIRNVIQSDVDTIEKKMQDEGISWTESDKSPGSRVNGMQLMRDRFEAVSKGEGPGLYFMDNCVASIGTIPSLPRDEEKIDDVDTSAEDHPYDMTRYRVLRGSNRFASEIKTTFAH